jgi:hypothetical protein
VYRRIVKKDEIDLGKHHLVFTCLDHDGVMKVRVEGIHVQELAGLSDVLKDTVSTEGIIKMGETPKKG